MKPIIANMVFRAEWRHYRGGFCSWFWMFPYGFSLWLGRFFLSIGVDIRSPLNTARTGHMGNINPPGSDPDTV